MRQSRWLAGFVIIITIGLFFVVLPHIRFTTSITNFLPKREPASASAGATRRDAVMTALTESNAAQTLIVDLGVTPDTIGPLSERLLAALRATPAVHAVTSAATSDDKEQIAAFLAKQAPWTFLSPNAFGEAAQRERLQQLMDRLAGPQGSMVAVAAPRDPLGGIWEFARAFEALKDPALTTSNDVLVSKDERHAFFFVTTKASAFDAPPQRAFLSELRAWASAQPERPVIHFAGAAPYAVASEAQIKQDIQTIGTWSTLGILALFALLFRSPRMILLALIPMGIGSIGGLLACQFIFGSVHGITIAFGTSLLGVGIDYAEHYYTHFALLPEEGPFRAMGRVWKSIALGGFTTVLGLAGLLFSGSTGLQEMAVFSAASVATAVVATACLIPPFMPRSYRKPALLEALHVRARGIVRAMIRFGRSPSTQISLLAMVLVPLIFGGIRARATDEVDLLMDSRGPHVTEDHEVRSRVESRPSNAVAILIAEEAQFGSELALLTAELSRAVERGELQDFPKLSTLFPSEEQQALAHKAAIASRETTRKIMNELEFAPDAFANYWSALDAAPRPYSLREFLASPLARALQIREQAGRFSLTLPLRGVSNLRALESHLTHGYVVDPRRELTSVFEQVRKQILLATAGGVVAIFLLLASRYRSARLALAASFPTLVAVGLTVSALSLAGVPLNILHLVALLLVLGMGVDYGVFLVDQTQTVSEAARSLVSILTASLTTILSFGLLALSANPGLAALGSTVAIGVTLSLILCPLAIAGFRVALRDEEVS